ncbi:MAG: hypothetical protein MJZ98_02880 [Paludibacteraceae bacterium]|nr:hypothetical protein [Paludibacteraceae bacterium]
MKKIALFACGLAAVMFCSCGKKQAEEAEVEEMDSVEVEVLDTIAEADTVVEEIVEEVVEEAKPVVKKATAKKTTTKPAVEEKKEEAPAHGAIKLQAGNTEAVITPGKGTQVEVKNEQLNTAGKVTVTAGGKKAAIAAQQNK